MKSLPRLRNGRAYIVFQLTDEELKRQNGLFSVSKVDNRIIESYLFLGVGHKGTSYSRTDLARIAREINKLTPMPSMLLFRYGDGYWEAVHV